LAALIWAIMCLSHIIQLLEKRTRASNQNRFFRVISGLLAPLDSTLQAMGLWSQAAFSLNTLNKLAEATKSHLAKFVLALLVFLLSAVNVAATTFTMSVPNTSLTLPSTYPQAGGVAIVLEGVNGNVYYQFVNPSTMFVGYQNTGTPVAWQGNPFQIGPAMVLNCGPVVSCSSYLGGSITRMTVRFTAYDGDNQSGQFDFNNLNLQINGSNFGASNGNWSVVSTQNTSLDGVTLISSNTGYGNNTFDTGWFQSTNAAILSNVLSTGTITARVLDSDPNDNFWDFARGNDASTATVPLNVAPGVTLDKSSTSTSFSSVGQIIPYTFNIRNIGSVWLNSIVVADPKISSVSCPPPPIATTINLDPGESIVCTANYTVTQADIDAGVINNTATVTGNPQAGTLGPVSDTNSIAGPAAAPAVDLTKTSAPSPSFGAVGSSITYSFAVRNAGNVTLSNVAITDPLLPTLSCTVPNIAPGATNAATCTGNVLTVTQSHVDAGTIANTATVTARAPSGATVNDTASVSLGGPAPLRALNLNKQATVTNFDAVGDFIAYSYAIENTGNVTLTGVLSVADDKVSVTCPVLPGGLAPAATVSCTASYTVSQSDLDAGQVVNTASATLGITTSAADQVTVPAVQSPALAVEKSSSTPSFNAVGDVLSYDYILRNTGNVTLTGAVSVADDKTAVSCDALPVAGLAPTGTLNCSASYTVTQADIDAGGVTNTATGTIGATTSLADQVTVPAVQNPSMSVAKTATSVNFINVGDTVDYEYSVTNTGNTTLTDPLTVSDNRIATVSCPALPPGGLAPLATLTCTASYTLVLADLDLGSVTNLATATSGSTTSPSTSETVPAGATPALTIAKSSGSTSFAAVGDLLSYSYVITNSGNASFTRAITVTDDKIAGPVACYTPSGADPTFTPGESVTCTASYAVTQADLDQGFVTNQAYGATTYGPANTPVTSPPASVTVNAAQAPALTVSKSATTLPVTTVGQSLSYTIAVANTGNVTLSSITVSDPLIPSLSCTIATLAPAASNATCSGSYIVTQADFDAGSISNTATANAISPQGNPVSDTDTLLVTITQTSALDISKTYLGNSDEDASGSVTLDDTLSYQVVATNNGSVSQSAVVVSDPLLTPASVSCASLLPGAWCILTGSLTVNQSQVDAGTLANSAAVTSSLLPTPETSSVSVPVAQTSSMNVTKLLTSNADQDGSGNVTRNDTLTYTVTMDNTGTVTLAGVTVSDPVLTPSSTTCAAVAPGSTCVLTGTYVVAQADVDAGSISNTGSVTSNLTPVAETTTIITPTAQSSTLAITKVLTSNADEDASSSINLNDTLTYTVTVSNTGSITQSNVVVSDWLLTPATVTCATVVPGSSCALTGTLVVTQAQVDAGSVVNSASVTSSLLPTPQDVTLTTTVPQTSALLISKSSSTPNFNTAGDVLSYSYAIENTGNVTLTGVLSVADDKVSVTCPVLPGGLAPAATVSCTASYTVSQSDLDAGQVVNTASATLGITTSAADQVTVPAVQSPALAVEKSSSTPSFNAVGDVLSYDYILRNTGNVTLTGAVSVADDKTAVSCDALPVAGLAPTGTLNCSASYTVTQADIDAGGVTNTATGTIGATTSLADQVTVPAVQNPSMSVAKTATSVNFINVGDTVDYEYSVTNTGNTTLTDPLTVSDNRIATVSCPALPPGGLAPLATLTCTASYTLVLADLDLGSVTNLATATSGSTTSPSTSETVPAGATPALTIAKSSGSTSFAAVGDLLSYSYVITNSGNASFTRAITVTDDKIAGPVACYTPSGADPTFTPGESVTCTASYAVTQADLDQGFVTNQAYGATTYGPANTPVTSPPASVTVNAAQAPALTVSKSATTLPVTTVGQSLSYTIAVANTGNVTLSSITVSDPLIPSLSCTIATLAPAASNATCSGSYIVTQADFDAGSISNTATANAISPQGNPVSDTDTLLVTAVTASSGVEMIKTSSIGNFTAVGQVVNFGFSLRNTGDVTLTNVNVVDPLPGFNCIVASLAPGEIDTSCNANYTVQQADVDAGFITNTATVSAIPARGAPPTDSSSVTLTGPPRIAALAFGKLALDTSYAAMGDVIDYSFTVTNTGNLTVFGPVTINDTRIPAVSCPAISAPGLLPGASLVCTGSYSVVQADIDAGSLSNTASANVATVLGTLTSAVDVETVGAISAPALTVVKAATSPTSALGSNPLVVDTGDQIDYTFTIANAGNVTLSGIFINDAKIGAVSCPFTSMPPGATEICTATYTLTTLDLDTGSVTNSATGSGTPLTGPPVTDTSGTAADNDTPTITMLPQAPAISVVKSSSTPSVTAGNNPSATDLGDAIDYTFTVTNTGNVSLGNVSVTDPKLTVVNCLATVLAPGSTTSCFGTYVLTQADIDAGIVTNSALASGNPPTGPPVTDISGTTGGNDTPTLTVIPQTPAIALVKTAGVINDLDGNGPDVGDTISYTFNVTNPGNVTIDNIIIDDPLVVAAMEPLSSPLMQLATLPAVDLTTTASIPVDLSAVIASEATSGNVDVPPIAQGLAVQRRLARLDKTQAAFKVGDQVGIVFAVTNTGMGPLINVAIEQGRSFPLGGPQPYLAPNQHDDTTFVFVYQLTAADIARGTLELPATATATSRNTELTQDISTALTLADAENLDELITASITPANIPSLAPGSSATFIGLYTLTQNDIDAGGVTNSATARGVAPDGTAVTDISDNTSAAPGASDPTFSPIARSGAITLVKTAGVPTVNLGANTSIVDAGDTIAYSFTLENTGNVTLNSIGIADAKVGSVTCPVASLAPDAIATCTASYVIAQADIDAGQITNTATGFGSPPVGPSVSDVSGNTAGDDDATVTPLAGAPSLTLIKTGAAATVNLGSNPTLTDVGDTIAYQFIVTNTGNVTLTSIAVADPKVGVVSCPLSTLAPQATTTCTGTYVLQQLDLDLGSVTNTATVTGQPPTGAAVSDVSGTADDNDAPTVNVLVQTPAIGLIKTASAINDVDGNGPDAGDTITYTFDVHNLGNTTLLNISITDPKVAVAGGPLASLLPGANDTSSFSATYTLTQADVDAGFVGNQAEVSGTPPVTPTNSVPTPVTDISDDNSAGPGANEETVVNIPQNPAIGLVKLSGGVTDLDGNGHDAGDTVAYTFHVHNLGNVTLTNIRLSDPKVAVSGGTLATLAPGVVDTTTFSATYVLTQDDIDNGQLVNSANVVGTPPSGPEVDDDSDGDAPGDGPGENDPTITAISQNPDIRLIKTADITGLGQPAPLPGETITYRFTVINNGNVTLTDVTVTDALPDIVLTGSPLAELQPGESNASNFTATYQIKAADIANGGVSNSAIATGHYENIDGIDQTESDQSGTTENNDTATTVRLVAQPSISIVKTAELNDAAPTGGNLGDTVTYRFVVTNTGNLPLDNISVDDPKLTAVTCADTTLNPGQSSNCTAPNYALTQDDLNIGEVTNQARVTGRATSGLVVSDLSGTAGNNDTPTIINIPLPQASFSKSASVVTAAIGETINFTLTAGQVVFAPATIIDTLPPGLTYVPGSAVVNGVAVEPVLTGRNLTFGDVSSVGGNIVISLRTVVNASAKNGVLVNKAQLIHPNGTVVARAQAKIEIRPEPVFDCGDIIGKVFDDKNGNGTQDVTTSTNELERGLPGVRVVTAKGELITTDKEGRFHIACAAIPDGKIGSKFILKVDPRSLPSGYRLTTENPKVIRLTRGKLSKLNFGASIGRVIRFNLSDKAFVGNDMELPGKLQEVVQNLMVLLAEEPSVLRLQYQVGPTGKAAALRRMEKAEAYIRAKWKQSGGQYKLPIETRLLKLQQESQK
jgi:large repetitive protein